MREALSSDDIPRSVGRVLDLLEIVIAEGGCNLTTAAAAAELTPTTALRHLRALEARGYLRRDGDGLFTAGPTIRRLAATVHDGSPLDRLIETAQPHLHRLAENTGESVYLAVSDGVVATYVAAAESARAIRHVGWVGQQVRLGGTAVGDALAAPGSVVTRTGAVEPDITAVSLGLPPLEFCSAAVSVIGPVHRMDGASHDHICSEIRRVVAALASDLGFGDVVEDAS